MRTTSRQALRLIEVGSAYLGPSTESVFTMIDRFEIMESGARRPDAERIVFCDGTGGDWFRSETDLELSHWRPNRTPPEFRAGSSTEICFRFLDRPRPGRWTAAVNNHVDVDGILSIYTLLHSEHALAHRATIVAAADMGDFWGWGELPAQRVFQAISLMMERDAAGREVYEEAFERIPGLIDGSDPQRAELESALTPLARGVELVESGQIVRRQLTGRLTHYIVPASLAGPDPSRAAYVPGFNEPISDKALLWPHVRARWDAERVCLVSTEQPGGWLHDLWYPGYLWADTDGKWIPPGFEYHDGMSRYALEHAELIRAFESLQAQESAAGIWGLGGTTLPLGEELQSQFPLVGRFADPHASGAASVLPPDRVADPLQAAFA